MIVFLYNTIFSSKLNSIIRWDKIRPILYFIDVITKIEEEL